VSCRSSHRRLGLLNTREIGFEVVLRGFMGGPPCRRGPAGRG
jgi:hypothetical protein